MHMKNNWGHLWMSLRCLVAPSRVDCLRLLCVKQGNIVAVRFTIGASVRIGQRTLCVTVSEAEVQAVRWFLTHCPHVAHFPRQPPYSMCTQNLSMKCVAYQNVDDGRFFVLHTERIEMLFLNCTWPLFLPNTTLLVILSTAVASLRKLKLATQVENLSLGKNSD